MSNFWIDVESVSGVKQGDGPIVSAVYWENSERLDLAGSFRFQMPASDVRAAVIQSKLTARCFTRVQDNVVEIGAGIIDKIGLNVDAQGKTMLVVEGNDLAQELAYRSVGALELTDGAGGGVDDALEQIIAFAPSGWSIDTSNGYGSTASNVYTKYAGESVLTALTTICKQRGEHFRIGAGRKIVWLRKELVSSGIRAVQGGEPTALDGNKDVCIITSLDEERDTYELCSRIYPFGNGVGEARLTIAASEDRTTPVGYTVDKVNNFIMRNSTESSYGRIDRYVSFKSITPISNTDADLQSAANMLYDAAVEYLERHKQPERFYRMQVAKVEKVLHPGQTVRAIVRKVVDGYDAVNIDRDLYILETINRIDSTGLRTTEMQTATVDRYSEADDTYVVERMQEARVMESYPQLGPSSYTIGWYDDMDDVKSAYLDFWLGKEVVNVNQVLLRFQVDALRSTVKAVTGSSTTTPSGGGSATASGAGGSGSTSATGGATSSTSNSSGVVGSNTGYENGSYDPVSGVYHHYHGYSLQSHTHYVSIPSHTHSISLPSHTHSITIPSHTHTFTPNVSMSYGIFEDSSAYKLREYSSTYKFWDLRFFINGTEIATSFLTPVDGATSWWYLDLSSYVADGITFRPLREYNRLEIRAATSGAGRRARMRGQLTVRTVIQAVAIV